MSEKTQLKYLKKDELVEMVSTLQKQISDLNKVEDSAEQTSVKVSELINQINRLEGELSIARQKEKFVAIQNLSLGRVWLYSPESKSGRVEDREKGRLLKKYGEIAIVPSYWMATYIADRAPAFLYGELCLNNKEGKKIAPNLVFEDLDLPDEFVDAVVSNEEIEEAIYGTIEEFYDFVDKYKDKKYILSRVLGIVDRAANDEKEGRKKAILNQLVTYLDGILHPDVEGSQEPVPDSPTIQTTEL